MHDIIFLLYYKDLCSCTFMLEETVDLEMDNSFAIKD